MPKPTSESLFTTTLLSGANRGLENPETSPRSHNKQEAATSRGLSLTSLGYLQMNATNRISPKTENDACSWGS